MQTLDAIFTESAQRFPSRPALFVAGQCWSYSQLDLESRALENALRTLGCPERSMNVGVLYARGVASYAAPLAIMRTGGVYVPLNDKMPAERLLRIIADAGIRAVVLDASETLSATVIEVLRRAEHLQIVIREADSTHWSESALQGAAHRLCRASPEVPEPAYPLSERPSTAEHRLAYIIYTSGSTGVPKGVAITHASARSCIEKLHRMFGTRAQDRFTQFSALSFDVSISDLFLCWKSGATLFVPTASEALVPFAFVARHEITVWSSVPSLAHFLLKLRLLKPNALPALRLSMFAGEALPLELTQVWAEAAPSSRILNLYGPTECTIFATCFEYEKNRAPLHGVVPIGQPLPGLRYMIVEDGRALDADEVTGELWVAGDQLAAEYWNNPAATQAAFVRCSSDSDPSAIWYRTGDLVSRHAGIGLIFRGRLDRQIKLRGYRVELQEIESALRDITGCARVAVLPLRGANGLCERLIAYCDDLPSDEATIKTRCASRLASYMVPERIVQLDDFPLSDHGKIDYRALAALCPEGPTSGAGSRNS